MIKLDYTCYKFIEYNFFLVKIPDNILTEISIAEAYDALIGNFIFKLNDDIQFYNDKNSLFLHSGNKEKLEINNVSNSILIDWNNKKKFIFKFVRENTNINDLDNEILQLPSNIIGVLQIN